MKGDVSIAIVAPGQPEDYFDDLWHGVWEATFDLGSFGVQVRNLTTNLHDVAAERQILEQLFEEQVNAIAIVPANISTLNDLIDQHVSAGTPVVTFLADAPTSRRLAFIGPDPYQAGVLAGEVLMKLMGNHGHVISFPGDPYKFHFALRYQGFKAALAGCKDQMSEDASLLDPESFATELYATRRDGVGVYVGNQDLVRVGTALERAGARVPCVGFGITERKHALLARRAVSAVIDDSRYHAGYFAVQKAYQAILARDTGERLAGVRIPSSVVFATNAAESGDSLRSAFELVVRQRTEVLFNYKQRLEKANAELVSLSITDPLTGLLNRRKFEEVIANEVARARRYGDLSLLIIDLNGFKPVNDRYGHQAGDEVLKAVARVLKACCRGTDTCARLGGDEFAVVLPHADSQAANVVRERIHHETLRTRVPIGERELGVALSIGAANMPTDASGVEELIAEADADMYRLKQASKLHRDPIVA